MASMAYAPALTEQERAALILPKNGLLLLVLAVALLALLLPVVGPAIDAHYTERDPYHSHLFLQSGALLHHTHFYDEQPVLVQEAPPAAVSRQLQAPQGIVFLPAADGASTEPAAVGAPAAAPAPVVPDPPEPLLLLQASDFFASPGDLVASPAWHPPRP